MAHWVFRSVSRRYRETDPLVLFGGPAVEAVLKRAGELGREGREDREAVGEVRAAANGDARTLMRAAQASRYGGLHHELRDQNSVFRLLDAARNSTPVAPMSDDDRVRIEAVDALANLSPEARWAVLCEHEPRLVELARQVRSGQFGTLLTPGADRSVDMGSVVLPDGRTGRRQRRDYDSLSAEETQDLHDSSRNYAAVRRRLLRLLGPEANRTDDVMLGTQSAQRFALQYLRNLRRSVTP